jgi:hypothetical protein
MHLFRTLCTEAATELREASMTEVAAQLSDPKKLHQRLYSQVLPTELQHLAGAYRGSAHPHLANLFVAFSFTETEATGLLARPHKVLELMFAYSCLIVTDVLTPRL